nr:uncharacterized protein LOC109187050 [Ipomoea batatas]
MINLGKFLFQQILDARNDANGRKELILPNLIYGILVSQGFTKHDTEDYEAQSLPIKVDPRLLNGPHIDDLGAPEDSRCRTRSSYDGATILDARNDANGRKELILPNLIYGILVSQGFTKHDTEDYEAQSLPIKVDPRLLNGPHIDDLGAPEDSRCRTRSSYDGGSWNIYPKFVAKEINLTPQSSGIGPYYNGVPIYEKGDEYCSCALTLGQGSNGKGKEPINVSSMVGSSNNVIVPPSFFSLQLPSGDGGWGFTDDNFDDINNVPGKNKRKRQYTHHKMSVYSFPTNVKNLLSTGIFEGVPVKYVSWSRGKQSSILQSGDHHPQPRMMMFNNIYDKNLLMLRPPSDEQHLMRVGRRECVS